MMTGSQTFTMIKPSAFKMNYAGAIIRMISEAGFQIRAMKLTKLTPEQAGAFYAVHKGKPFYDSLIDFMSSGPIVAMVLEKENAVEDFRNFIGATNPANAAEGTVRKLYGTNLQQNAVHGSDSDENAIIEADFFFSRLERYM
jgi:nucleoside-diphosphate kinase